MLSILALDTQRYAIWREDKRDLADLASERVDVAQYLDVSSLLGRALGETYDGGVNPAVFGDELGLGLNEPVVLDPARAMATLGRVDAAVLEGVDVAVSAAYRRLVAFFEKCVLKRWTPVATLAI